MAEKLIELKAIRIDGGTQPRDGIDAEAVRNYAEDMERGDKFPSVTVYFDGKAYWLADGFHRVHAHNQAGETKIRATVLRGTVDDAKWFACGANQRHGIRRTRADIEHAVRLALELRANESNVKLAKHVGVSDETIRRWRERLSQPNSRGKGGAPLSGETAPKSLRDKDRGFEESSLTGVPGTSDEIDMDSIPMDPPPPDDKADPVDEKARAWVAEKRKKGYPDERIRIMGSMRPAEEREAILRALGGSDDAVKPGAKTPAPAAVPVDDLGTALPENVQAAFRRKQEIQDMITLVGQVRKRVLEGHEHKDPLYLGANPSQFLAETKNLHRSLKAMKPFAVCPFCGGPGCRACLKRGWVDLFTFKASPAGKKMKKQLPDDED